MEDKQTTSWTNHLFLSFFQFVPFTRSESLCCIFSSLEMEFEIKSSNALHHATTTRKGLSSSFQLSYPIFTSILISKTYKPKKLNKIICTPTTEHIKSTKFQQSIPPKQQKKNLNLTHFNNNLFWSPIPVNLQIYELLYQ